MSVPPLPQGVGDGGQLFRKCIVIKKTIFVFSISLFVLFADLQYNRGTLPILFFFLSMWVIVDSSSNRDRFTTIRSQHYHYRISHGRIFFYILYNTLKAIFVFWIVNLVHRPGYEKAREEVVSFKTLCNENPRDTFILNSLWCHL